MTDELRGCALASCSSQASCINFLLKYILLLKYSTATARASCSPQASCKLDYHFATEYILQGWDFSTLSLSV